MLQKKILSNRSETQIMNYTYLVANFPNGDKQILTYIDHSNPNAQWLTKDASSYFEQLYEGHAFVRTVSDSVFHPEEAPENSGWVNLRENLGKIDYEDKLYEEMIERLKDQNVSSVVINDLANEWDIKGNEEYFRKLVSQNYSVSEQKDILKALDFAKVVHKDKQKPKKAEVEYYNHCVRVATLAILLKLSAEDIQTSLLHDSIEDVRGINKQYLLDNGFSKKVVDQVDKLTKDEFMAREEYLEGIYYYPENLKLIKCLDRFHNLLRAFTSNKPEYWKRYLAEVNKYFIDEFMNNPKLLPLGIKFNIYMTELASLIEKNK